MSGATVLKFLFVLGTPLAAQWLNYPTPGIPRTADGKPDLAAPAPKMPDGHPDVSGLWRIVGTGYAFNITGDLKDDIMLPPTQAVYRQHKDSYGKDEPGIKCLPPGPRTGLLTETVLRMVQSPSVLAVLYEEGPYRQVFLDGRPLPVDPNPTWMGYSTGHWDGDTLVIETAGYNDKTWLDFSGHPHSEALHVTERFRRRDFGHMRLQMTFEDPKAYTQPWTIAMGMIYVPDTEMLEYVCNENERDRDHLVGKLADEGKGHVKLSNDILAQYVGAYASGLRVSMEADQLILELPSGGGKQPIFPRSVTQFDIPTFGSTVEFVKDADGKVTRLLFTTVEGERPFPRLR